MVGVKDVAREAGVSIGTVSNVLNAPDRVAPHTRQRVLDTIERLGFVRNEAARQLGAGQSSAIGIVIPDLTNPFFTTVADAAQRQAESNGYSVLLAASQGSAEVEAAHIDLFRERRLRGLLISPTGDGEPTLPGENVVLVDRHSSDIAVSSVSVDDELGGELAVQHLAAKGCHRVAIVGGQDSARQVRERLTGARRAADRLGLTLTRHRAAGTDVQQGRTLGGIIGRLPQKDRPEGIFAVDDLIAIGVLQALVLDCGIRVPAQICVIGYDDIAFAASALVPLSSVSQPARELGQLAIDLLIRGAGSAPEQLVLQPAVVARASTGRQS